MSEHDELDGLLADLAAAPLPPPPTHLDERARALARPPAERPARRWGWAALVAAALLAFALRPPAGIAQPARVELNPSATRVEGRAALEAARFSIEVDGAAGFAWEPGAASEREGGVEEPMRNQILAAATGAILTITVYEGLVIVRDGEDESVLQAGQQARLETDSPMPRPESARRPASPRPSPAERDAAATTAELADARAEIEQLQQMLAIAQMESALNRGRLAATEGEQSEWPADPAPGFGREEMQEIFPELLDGLGELELIDCDEYPCIAILRPLEEGEEEDPEWPRRVQDGVAERMEEPFGSGNSMMLSASSAHTDEGPRSLIGLAILPGGETDEDPNLGLRTSFRLDNQMTSLAME